MLSVRDAIWMTVICLLAALWWTDRTVLAESVRLLRQGLEIQKVEAVQSRREVEAFGRRTPHQPVPGARG
jgi:hypothetical protein